MITVAELRKKLAEKNDKKAKLDSKKEKVEDSIVNIEADDEAEKKAKHKKLFILKECIECSNSCKIESSCPHARLTSCKKFEPKEGSLYKKSNADPIYSYDGASYIGD
jgi:septal ring factor EnvC (AmiA/AmiB activator)